MKKRVRIQIAREFYTNLIYMYKSIRIYLHVYILYILYHPMWIIKCVPLYIYYIYVNMFAHIGYFVFNFER